MISRVVVARGPFDTVGLHRQPESVAFTSPINATGMFELEPEGNLLLPFEGMGMDAVWQLEMPRPANPFDYRSIADVLITFEYTALSSPSYQLVAGSAVSATRASPGGPRARCA